MSKLKVIAGPYTFEARLERDLAPKTCESFLARLPFVSQVVHVRWSGEGVWMPLGDETVAFAEALQAEGVSVRPFPGEGARVTIGEREANDLFLTTACAWRR